MELAQYLKTRPWAYHLTARQNIDAIREQGALLSADRLARLPAEKEALTVRRTRQIQMEAALIRDQLPLQKGHIEFESKFTFELFLGLLNSLVFFWPGGASGAGPIPAGMNHFKRYQHESPVILRTCSAALIAENTHEPLFCAYNSGAPRTYQGIKSPRGPNTFVPIKAFPRNASEVVELVFSGIAILPATTEMADSLDGPWVPLFKV